MNKIFFFPHHNPQFIINQFLSISNKNFAKLLELTVPSDELLKISFIVIHSIVSVQHGNMKNFKYYSLQVYTNDINNVAILAEMC